MKLYASILCSFIAWLVHGLSVAAFRLRPHSGALATELGAGPALAPWPRESEVSPQWALQAASEGRALPAPCPGAQRARRRGLPGVSR